MVETSRYLFAMVLATLLLVNIPAGFGAVIQGKLYTLDLEPVTNAYVILDSSPQQKLFSKDGTYRFEVPSGTYDLRVYQLHDDLRIAASATEQITLADEGAYILDFIVFPDVEEDILFISDIDLFETSEEIEPLQQEQKQTILPYVLAILSIIILIDVLVYVLLRRGNRQETESHESPHNDSHSVIPAAEATVLPSSLSAGEVKQETLQSENIAVSEEVLSPEVTEMLGADSDDKMKLIDELERAGGRMTQKELRQHLPLSEAKVSLVLSELEDEGRVKKIKKGRGNILILTKKSEKDEG